MEDEVVVTENQPQGLVFTYKVPARGGAYYYLAVEGESSEEAQLKAEGLVSRLPGARGTPRNLSILGDIDQLVIGQDFQDRFKEVGFAHMRRKGKLPPYSARTGHKGFLPD